MIPTQLKNKIISDDKKIIEIKQSFRQPFYNSSNYYKDIANSNYFFALLILRHYIKIVSDYYFSQKLNAKNIDLFMMTNSISSPIGPGSDSEAIKIKLGRLKTFLTDSAQFGFEPLLLSHFDKVYCYLPSMRGEDCNERHLNQFFHCEMEMKGVLNDLIPHIESYVKILCQTVLLMENVIKKISDNPDKTRSFLINIIKSKKFPVVEFDDAVKLLLKRNKKFVHFTKQGRDINNDGEKELFKILKINTPLWLKYFDRDKVPFYQKPHPSNKDKTINADLLFPPLIQDSFGGEIIGSGQRQNKVKEIYESFGRQKISSKNYEWYIDLRRFNKYKTTSGFGLGIERFIAWALAKKDIKDVMPYPRLKNIITWP